MTQNGTMSTLSWQNRVKGLANNFINFVFPPRCVNCHAVGSLLCLECRAQIEWLTEPLCPQCGRTLDEPQLLCRVCRKRPLPLTQIRAATLFTEPIPKMIHNFKYNGQFGLSVPLVEVMVEAWSLWKTAVDVVIPIPLHPQRKKARGYNQSALLAKRFGKQLSLHVREESLCRVKNTPPQVNLNAIDRQNNMYQAFIVKDDMIDGQNILLIDDVCTTGATMASAAEALLAAGAKSVAGYCVARAM